MSSVWQKVKMARHQDRATTLEFIDIVFTDFFALHGDRTFGDDQSIVGGIAVFDKQPVTVIGTQKGRNIEENIMRNFGMPHPEGYRKALRLMKQAEKFNRPIITFIDVVGAYPGIAAEERGQGLAIAECIEQMSFLTVPLICIITGEGGSGGALALGVGDRVLMLENAWYGVISPESGANILWKDSTLAPKAAELFKITPPDLKKFGIIDEIISESSGGAHLDHTGSGQAIAFCIRKHLAQLLQLSPEQLVNERLDRYRKIGQWQEKHKLS